MKYLLLLFCFIVFIILFAVYRKKSMVFSPASLFSIVWLILIFFYLIFDDASYQYNGVYWLIIAITVVNFGQLISTIGFDVKKYKKQAATDYNRLKKFTLIICIPLILISTFDYFKSGGFSNISQVAFDYYTNANETTLFDTIWSQIFSLFMYVSGLIGGKLFCASPKKTKGRVIALLPFATPIIMMLTSSGKLGVIVVGITFIIGYIVESINQNKDFSFRRFGSLLKKYWIFIPILVGLFAFSLALRQGSFSWGNFEIALNKVKSYAFGSPAAFNIWFSKRDFNNNYSFGMNTFGGIFHALGLFEREKGVYQNEIHTSVWNTNVFTAFRGIIMDFGTVFGIVFLFVVGIVFGVSYKCYVKSKKNFSLWVLLNCFLFSFYSIIISPFIYLNLSLLFFFYLVLKMIKNKKYYSVYRNSKEKVI